MSYDMALMRDGGICTYDAPVERRQGTYQVGGSTQAEINITYNYSKIFRREFGDGGLSRLEGVSGKDSVVLLDAVISRLKDDAHEDYWQATEGNARVCLMEMRAMARDFPDAVWVWGA